MRAVERFRDARWLDAFSSACVFAIGVSLSIFTIVSGDIGFHLGAGRLIWEAGRIPTEDPFSYLVEGRPWLDSHWLFQVLVHSAYSSWGAPGLVVLRVLAVCTLIGGLLFACRRRASLSVALIVTLVATLASTERFMVRPDLFSLAFLAVYVAGSERFSARPGPWLVGLPLLQVVWTNTHGLHVLGPVYLALRFAGDLLDAAWLRMRGRDAAAGAAPSALRQRALLTILCSLAMLANANGLAGIAYPFQLFLELRGQVSWFPIVEELQSPLRQPIRSIFQPLLYYWVMVGLGLISLVGLRSRPRFGELLPGAAFLYLSLEALRNTPLFGVVAAPWVAAGLGELARRQPSGLGSSSARVRFATALGIGLATLGIVLGTTTGRLYQELRWPHRFGVGEQESYPSDEIVERLRGTPGRILNDPNLGGYLIWKLYPDKQVAFDGRWEVYGELFLEARRALYDPRAFERFSREYGVTAVVVTRGSMGATRWTPSMMKADPRFRLTAQTMHTLLYERVGPAAPTPARAPEGGSS